MKIGFLKKEQVTFDPWLTGIVFFLTVIGLFAVYSAAAEEGIPKELQVQLLATGLGLILVLAVSFVDLRTFAGYNRRIYAVCVLALVFVLLFGSGKAQTGANSWIRIGPVSLQPSEPVKVLFALSFAEAIARARRENRLSRPKEVLKLFLTFLPICGLIVLQNDTGTALVFVFMFCVMLFAGGLKLRYFIGTFAALAAAIPFVWTCLAPYQKNRIIVFLRPETDPSGAGYQVMQSKLSIAGGGAFGRGWMQGPNSRLSLLPEKETDFIFAAFGEEFGFLGCAVVVVLLFSLCIRCFMIGAKAKDCGGRLACVGIGAMFLFHVIENLCMCIGLLPVTGIPLPFISYGGSAQLTGFFAFGVVQNIYAASKSLRFYKS